MQSNTGQHIPFSRLVDLADGRLGADDQAEIEPHLRACPLCASDLAWLRRVIELMRADGTTNPPAHVVAAAKRLFRKPAMPGGLPARKQLSATLHFDSMQAPVAMGLRAGAQADRQMLFTTADYLVDLRIVPSGALWAVSGQLLGADAGEQVELRSPTRMARVPLNDMSEFALPPMPPGSYTLTVGLADLDITITDLELGAE
jgi:anti-sigma factor RsiW